ncbi:hypothetical protein D3H65_13915 [Paraflavitalea soli]|uniref:Uncharacterized protein n=1 Tax=Paraflavitalea soli TaxID=2315862 RepID=A0A3B7MNW5_9BACT|nr:hypothetical protein D3H65_13915 [Paraflavitalea soli]
MTEGLRECYIAEYADQVEYADQLDYEYPYPNAGTGPPKIKMYLMKYGLAPAVSVYLYHMLYAYVGADVLLFNELRRLTKINYQSASVDFFAHQLYNKKSPAIKTIVP